MTTNQRTPRPAKLSEYACQYLAQLRLNLAFHAIGQDTQCQCAYRLGTHGIEVRQCVQCCYSPKPKRVREEAAKVVDGVDEEMTLAGRRGQQQGGVVTR
jgi:hypothetical protein